MCASELHDIVPALPYLSPVYDKITWWWMCAFTHSSHELWLHVVAELLSYSPIV
jgi:hypothetical protein